MKISYFLMRISNLHEKKSRYPLMCFLIAILLLGGIIFPISGCSTLDNCSDPGMSRVINKIGGEPVIPRDANRIFIPDVAETIGNKVTAEKMTIRVRDIISKEGRLSVVSDVSNADLVLIIRIVQYQVQGVEYGNQREPVKKRLLMVALVQMRDVKRKKLILRGDPVQAFLVFSDTVPPITTIYQAQDKVVDSLADRVVNKAVTGWYTELMTNMEKGK